MSHYIRGDEAGSHIKPCPHCGNLHTVFWDQGKGCEFGENVNCELCSPTMDLEQWNNRPTERVLEEKIVRLKALNAELLALLEQHPDVKDSIPYCDNPDCIACGWTRRACAVIAKAKGE